jgi:hypothetical protein
MACNSDQLENFRTRPNGPLVQLGDNSMISSAGQGDYILRAGDYTLCMNNVLVVPQLGKNLFSPGQAAASGLKFLIDGDFMTIYKMADFTQPTGNILAKIRKSPDNLYRLDKSSLNHSACYAKRHYVALPLMLWHARLGHTNISDVIHLSEKAAEGIKLQDKKTQQPFCEPCVLGKMSRGSFSESKNTYASPGDLIVSDIMGPFSTTGIDGSKYFVTYMDVNTRFCTAVLIRNKSDQINELQRFHAKFTNRHNARIKEFQSDNGGEYMSNEAKRWFDINGIHHRRVVPGDSQSNGLAERLNRTLTDLALSLLAQSKLPAQCFPWAIQVAVHIANRRPHSSLAGHITPYEALYKKQPNLHYLRIFGCVAFRHLHDNERKKVEFRAQKLIHIGYATNQRAYLLYDPIAKKNYVSRDVEFDESSFEFGFGRELQALPTSKGSTESIITLKDNADTMPIENVDLVPSESDSTYLSDDVSSDSYPDAQIDVPIENPVRRSNRISRPPADWWISRSANHVSIDINDSDLLARPSLTTSKVNAVPVPQTVAEAMQGQFSGHWHDAMSKEIQQLADYKTWTLEDLPAGRKPIACKWVFDIKPSLDGNNQIRKFKARLVVKGFSQRAGIDYNETFSPVAHHESFRVIFALAAEHSLILRQIDVVGAFLNGSIDDEIFMNQPEGFIKAGQESKVCKLTKALYGLKQAGMIWNQNLDEFLAKQLQFRRTRADPCVYVLQRDKSIIILGVYVDDILLAHNDEILCNEIVSQFSKKWDITDLKAPSRFLGMEISRASATGPIALSQRGYIEDILTKFNMANCKPAPTPHQPGFYLSSTMSPTSPNETLDMKNVPYAELVGSLNWLSSNTRPDISTSVGTLCRFISNPGRAHWHAALRVLRYLSATLDNGICYRNLPQSKSSLLAYSDADWAGDPDRRRSTTGYLFTFANGPIAWKSKLQKSSALSSVEAEYIAACSAGREAKWIRQLLSELSFPVVGPTTIFEDNQGCIAISNNNRTDSRTKHIDIKYHFVRDMVQNHEIHFQYVATDKMLADFLTKPTNIAKFTLCCRNLLQDTRTCLRGRVEYQPDTFVSTYQATSPSQLIP